jgi:hypothetical protein
MTTGLLRPLTFGEILDGAFTLYRRHFLTFFLTALIALLPLPLMLGATAVNPAEPGFAIGAMLVLAPVMMVAYFTLWAALTWQSARAIQGHSPTIGDGFRQGIRNLLSLLGAIVLIGLITGILGIPVILVVGAILVGIGMAMGDVAGVVLGVLLMMLLYAFFLGVLAMLFAVPAAVVIERQGAWDAIKRSWHLSAGARLRVAGVFIVTSLIVTLPTIGLYAVGAGTGMFSISPDAAPNPVWVVLEAAMTFLISALTYPFWAAALTLLYFDRRVRKEAYDLEVAAEGLAIPG